MLFKLHYSSKKKKVINTIRLYFINLLFDYIKITLINIPLFFLIFFIFSSFMLPISENTSVNLSKISNSIFILLLVIEFVTVCIVEYKQRHVYVLLHSQGIIIHAGNYESFGISQIPKKDIFIPYSRILSCYIAIPYNIEKDVSFMYRNTFDDIRAFCKHTIAKRHLMNIPLVLPSIKGGRYEEECIMVELDNNRIIAFPINECSEFLEKFEEYFSEYS